MGAHRTGDLTAAIAAATINHHTSSGPCNCASSDGSCWASWSTGITTLHWERSLGSGRTMPRRHVIDAIEIALPAQQLGAPLRRSRPLQSLLQHLCRPSQCH